MGRLDRELASHHSVGLDTCVFIYHFEHHSSYLSLTEELLSNIENGHWHAVISMLAVMEVAVRPWQLGRADVAAIYERNLSSFPHLELCDVTIDVVRQAARLRGQYNLGTPDALHVATSMVNGATVFVTNDHQLRRVAEEIDIVVLSDFV